MSKLEYKNGCVACNECGRLFEVPLPGDPPELVCPCGNSETLDALTLVADTFKADEAAPAAPPKTDKGRGV